MGYDYIRLSRVLFLYIYYSNLIYFGFQYFFGVQSMITAACSIASSLVNDG